MVQLIVNRKWKLPINGKQYFCLIIVYSIIYYLIDVDAYFNQYGEIISFIIFAASFLLIEAFIYQTYLMIKISNLNTKGNTLNGKYRIFYTIWAGLLQS